MKTSFTVVKNIICYTKDFDIYQFSLSKPHCITVSSLQDGHLWDGPKCPSYKESNKGNKQRQGPTLGVRFTEVSVKRDLTVHLFIHF